MAVIARNRTIVAELKNESATLERMSFEIVLV
jgi:hypothetical protein